AACCHGADHVAAIPACKVAGGVPVTDERDVFLALDGALRAALARAGARILIARARSDALENFHVVTIVIAHDKK
ncbi:MAG: hypothetical protein KJ956_14825, partial [Actinobacteria bacterium]|nr:hypothetical protein [Actinomycetota bacterium]